MSESESKEEQLSLDSVARLLLEECRMVLPGIQALFGFQLIAVFNEGFSDKLTPGEQELHLAAIIFDGSRHSRYNGAGRPSSTT